MRAKRLRTRGATFIQSPQEVSKKQITFGKYLYLVALAIGMVVLLNWTYHRLFFVDGVGFLEAETTMIEARTPGRILAINCQIDDTISVGEPLIVLGGVLPSLSDSRSGRSLYRADRRKLIDVQNRISLLEKQIVHARARVQSLRDEVDRAWQLFRLDAITRTQYTRIEQKLRTAEYELTILRIKYENELRLLDAFEQQMFFTSNHRTIRLKRDRSSAVETALKAPGAGVISAIYKQKGEIAKVGEPILKIVNPDKSFIKTYFKGSLEDMIGEGDRVKVVFENGERSDGVIRKIYPTAFTQPPEFKNRFGSVQRYLIAEIVPKGATSWDRILETKVKVLAHKKWF